MGIFDQQADIWTSYRATLQFRDHLHAGFPGNPKLVEGWIASKVGADTEVMRLLWVRSLQEAGLDAREDMTLEELRAIAGSVAGETSTNVFKRTPGGELYIEGRQVKAMLKEALSIAFAGQRFGETSKGALNFFAERVFVDPDTIRLGRTEPDGLHLKVTHSTGPQGPRSSLNRCEYVTGAQISFTVRVFRDCYPLEDWAVIWTVAQEVGLGANRSQGYGRFDIVEWAKLHQGRTSVRALAAKTPGAGRNGKAEPLAAS
jgi:hypothetical protein